jgi:hypothetical protein
MLGFQFAGVLERPHVTIGVAKGVAKELRLHTVQGVNFDESIARRFRMALLDEMRPHTVQFSIPTCTGLLSKPESGTFKYAVAK